MPKCILLEQDTNNSPILQSIEITNPPNKTEYLTGDKFDITGMVVTAKYSDGSINIITAQVTRYTVLPAILADEDEYITVIYTEDGVTSTARQNITVNNRLTKIEITTQPSKTSYEYGDTLSTDGMVVTATYSDGSSKIVNNYTCNPTTLTIVTNNQPITVSYTENGATQTAIFYVEVNRKIITKPTWRINSFTYNGNVQSVDNTNVWDNYNPKYMTIGGVTSAINAGTYTAVFTPKRGCYWEDGSIAAESVNWIINKEKSSLWLDKTSITLNKDKLTDTITLEYYGDGTPFVESEDTSIATATLNGTTITVNSVNETGTTRIRVRAIGNNYTDTGYVYCYVNCEFLPPIGTALDDMTWDDISTISRNGLASNYFSIGDRKAVALNGPVGNYLTLNNTYYCYIIGIDHNAEIEGTNLIHFQFGYSALEGGSHLAFIDTLYNEAGNEGDELLCMNSIATTNRGGWQESAMRNVICSAFLETMPLDLQNVLMGVTKYSDNIGEGSQNSDPYFPPNVTETEDIIFLLSEFEVFGRITYANSAEQDFQAQYPWYSTGNPTERYQHDPEPAPAPAMLVKWWLRSVVVKDDMSFCCAEPAMGESYDVSTASFGFAPAFCV